MLQKHAEDDEALLERTVASQQQAFQALVQRYEASIFRFIKQQCKDREKAEDILQETFLSAWRGAATFRGESSVRSWLFTIARNAVFRAFRKRQDEPKHFEPLEELAHRAGFGSTPERDVMQKQTHEQLWSTLENLSESDREILTLRDLEGFTVSETMGILGIGEAAVKSRLHRARLRLFAKLHEGANHDS